jgi:hypothetical protein
MPTLQERIEIGNISPKTFYKDYNPTDGGKK